jgi:hypothetical protein
MAVPFPKGGYLNWATPDLFLDRQSERHEVRWVSLQRSAMFIVVECKVPHSFRSAMFVSCFELEIAHYICSVGLRYLLGEHRTPKGVPVSFIVRDL